ncbi:hypothetical protein [uncultured Slackia sp.]|uniref:hypothetical protein n=1 Tax=uncultured Slackia sp. TaxID=665903 RepID=UPI0026DA8932|nr:hypothetical protein [uncultured Slackia sp.]
MAKGRSFVVLFAPKRITAGVPSRLRMRIASQAMPESPRWLIKHAKFDEASQLPSAPKRSRSAWGKLRGPGVMGAYRFRIDHARDVSRSFTRTPQRVARCGVLFNGDETPFRLLAIQ